MLLSLVLQNVDSIINDKAELWHHHQVEGLPQQLTTGRLVMRIHEANVVVFVDNVFY